MKKSTSTKTPVNIPVASVEQYMQVGCGRCPLGGTPECKVHAWTHEFKVLRELVLESGLTEEIKWSAPCYTHSGHNVAMLGALKDSCVLSFFDGASLEDPAGILERPGPNSREGRVIRFTSISQIKEQQNHVRQFLAQAIAVASGERRKAVAPTPPFEMPEELTEAFRDDASLKKAFEALTPGRQRGYLLHFNQAKQSATRRARIAKCEAGIRLGKGLHD
jgi:uncharacterized protein YdeI (YjbR/CyaY-like superfamily)